MGEQRRFLELGDSMGLEPWTVLASYDARKVRAVGTLISCHLSLPLHG